MLSGLTKDFYAIDAPHTNVKDEIETVCVRGTNDKIKLNEGKGEHPSLFNRTKLENSRALEVEENKPDDMNRLNEWCLI